MQEILQKLCERFPAALGAAVCDSEGESIDIALGSGHFPEASLKRVESSFPLQYNRASWTEEKTRMFALRQWAAEPSRSTGLVNRAYEFAGDFQILDIFSIRSQALDLVVGVMEDHMYLVLVLARPNLNALAQRAVRESKEQLNRHFAQIS